MIDTAVRSNRLITRSLLTSFRLHYSNGNILVDILSVAILRALQMYEKLPSLLSLNIKLSMTSLASLPVSFYIFQPDF